MIMACVPTSSIVVFAAGSLVASGGIMAACGLIVMRGTSRIANCSNKVMFGAMARGFSREGFREYLREVDDGGVDGLEKVDDFALAEREGCGTVDAIDGRLHGSDVDFTKLLGQFSLSRRFTTRKMHCELIALDCGHAVEAELSRI